MFFFKSLYSAKLENLIEIDDFLDTPRLGKLAVSGGIHHRPCGERKYRRYNEDPLSRRMA